MDLKPCPFCGSRTATGEFRPPKLIDVPNESDGLHMAVECQVEGCWATIEEWTLDDPATAVVARWNRRAI